MRAKRKPDIAKHGAIIAGATRLFLRLGYSATTMDAVAAEAQVTKQTVYAHYRSKDALFTEMVAGLCDKHAPPEALLEKGGKPVEELLYIIGLAFMNLVTSPEVLGVTRLVIAEALNHPKLARRFYESGTQRMVTLLQDFLNRQNRQGALRIANTRSAASYFYAMLKGSYHIRMTLNIKPTPSPKEKITHVRETVRIFMKVYGGPNPLNTRDVL